MACFLGLVARPLAFAHSRIRAPAPQLYKFLARRTSATFNDQVFKRLCMSKSNRPPMGLGRVHRYMKGACAVANEHACPRGHEGRLRDDVILARVCAHTPALLFCARRAAPARHRVRGADVGLSRFGCARALLPSRRARARPFASYCRRRASDMSVCALVSAQVCVCCMLQHTPQAWLWCCAGRQSCRVQRP